jgi:hypothetical protein
MPVFHVKVEASFEVYADDESQAAMAAIAVSGGCSSDSVKVGERRLVGGCIVHPTGSEVVFCDRRLSQLEIIEKFGGLPDEP